MPSFDITAPSGRKYRVEGPEGATQDQAYDILQQHLQSEVPGSIAGRFGSGLAHGLETPIAQGMKMMGMQPWDSYRQYEDTKQPTASSVGEEIGGAVPYAAIRATGPIGAGVTGAVTGALQPANSWRERMNNTAIGVGSAELGPLAGAIKPRYVHAADELANLAAGYMTGSHWYGLPGGMGGAFIGDRMGFAANRIAHRLGIPHAGAVSLLRYAVRTMPGLAAYLGVQAGPPAYQAIKPAAEQTYHALTDESQP